MNLLPIGVSNFLELKLVIYVRIAEIEKKDNIYGIYFLKNLMIVFID